MFDQRSHRVIAACRMAIAALFLVALRLDPSPAIRSQAAGELMLSGYVLISLALVLVAWNSWWLDHHLAAPALVLDVLVFLGAVFLTETAASDFISPFLSFFVFLLLSANGRWGWAATARLAFAVSAAFILIGVAVGWLGLPIELARFGRRLSYMALLGIVLVWLGAQNQRTRAPRFSARSGRKGRELGDALAYAATISGARGGALAWCDNEEPRAQIVARGLADDSPIRLPAEALEPARSARPALYDSRRGRQLILGRSGRISARRHTAPAGLAAHLPTGEGLIVPLAGSTGFGQLILFGIPGMGGDHLRLVAEAGAEIVRTIDHEQLSEAANRNALVDLKGSIARDLHDSVAQTLAGVSFRLAALRGLIAGGGDPIAELEKIQTGISGEQDNLRAMIAALRDDRALPGERDLPRELRALADQLGRQWGIAITVESGSEAHPVPALLALQIQQLVREAVANAVRHGDAKSVTLGIARGAREIALTIRDDGRGFPATQIQTAPRSLAERIESLGGTLAISSRPGETLLSIILPVRGRT